MPADITKHYKCFFCEEEIEFSLPPEKKFLKNYNLTLEWRHVRNGRVYCSTRATPSSVQVFNPDTLLTKKD